MSFLGEMGVAEMPEPPAVIRRPLVGAQAH